MKNFFEINRALVAEKKLFFFYIVAVTLCSCAATRTFNYVQVLKTAPVDKTNIAVTNEGMMYTDDNCSILYHLWSEGGYFMFTIFNKSDKIIYLDLSKSFFVKNGIAYDYYINRSYENSSSVTSSQSVAVAGIYTAVASGEGSTTIASTTIHERPVIAIPPKASKVLSDYTIWQSVVLDCDLLRYPGDSASITYDVDNSPITYSNYLTYRVGEEPQEKTVENKFYISRVSNYAAPTFSKYVLREKKPCQNLTNEIGDNYKPHYTFDIYDKVINVDITNCFYINYQIVTDKQLYKKTGEKSFYYDPENDGYIVGTSTEHEKYVQNLVNPFAKPE